jgi:hypothetical protein
MGDGIWRGLNPELVLLYEEFRGLVRIQGFYQSCGLDQWFSVLTSSSNITWELVRNANASLPQTSCSKKSSSALRLSG